MIQLNIDLRLYFPVHFHSLTVKTYSNARKHIRPPACIPLFPGLSDIFCSVRNDIVFTFINITGLMMKHSQISSVLYIHYVIPTAVKPVLSDKKLHF